MWKTLLLGFILTLLPLASARAGNSASNFGGIGIDGVPRVDGQIEVRQLVTGGPAHQAGVKIGDVITKIDGKPTLGSDFKKMVEYRLRGRAGTKVLLTISRPGEEKPLHFTLVRRQLVTKTR